MQCCIKLLEIACTRQAPFVTKSTLLPSIAPGLSSRLKICHALASTSQDFLLDLLDLLVQLEPLPSCQVDGTGPPDIDSGS